MSDPAFDVKRAHRWFAVELNNLAWDLLEAPHRSPAETERMIHAAHAACFHWLEVGTLLNHLRAQCLLSTAYAKADLPEAAVRHAQRCLALCSEAADARTAFDEATAHGCASLAYSLAARIDEARAEHKLALAAIERFKDPADAEIIHRLYPAP